MEATEGTGCGLNGSKRVGGEYGDISLVVTDLDGTLWDTTEVAHELSLQALQTFSEKHIPVLVATGRTLRSARDLLERNGLSLPIIGLDGAIGEYAGGGPVFHRAPFDRRDAEAILHGLQSRGLEPLAHIDAPPVDAAVETTADLPSRQEEHYGERLARYRLTDLVQREPVYQILTYGNLNALEQASRDASRHGHCIIIREALFGGPALTVDPFGATKWRGVERYCELEQIDSGRVLAVGNGENDVELLRRAKVACVVRDGCAEALAVAAHVVDPAERGGWAEVLEIVWPVWGAEEGSSETGRADVSEHGQWS